VAKSDLPRKIAAEAPQLLRKERKRRGLSIYRLSKMAGVSQQTISYVERGKNLKDFIAITDLLQKSPSKIEVSVTDFTTPKRTLHFNFATDNVSEVMGKLMK
jgi:transcriptional regulator with XRE-family HTH domain